MTQLPLALRKIHKIRRNRLKHGAGQDQCKDDSQRRVLVLNRLMQGGDEGAQSDERDYFVLKFWSPYRRDNRQPQGN